MTGTLYRGTLFGCAVALLMGVLAWAAPSALAADSIYWSSYTNAGAVRVGDLGGSGARDLLTGESSPEGVAIDAAAGKIYWADTTSGAIRVANLDGSGARDLYTGETQPSGVAIDPAAGLLYWANAVSGSGAIRVGRVDGSGARTLFAGESYPVGVTIDPADGKIYWGSYDTFKIRVGNLDGTGATDLFTGENYPTQLAIDPAAGKLYWTNEFGGNIRVGNLNGTGAASLYTGEGDVGGVAIDPVAGKIYWSNWNLGTVRVGSLAGTTPPQSLYTGQNEPWFVALLHAPLGTGSPQVSGSRRGRPDADVQPGKLGVRSAERFSVSRAADPRVSMDHGWRAHRRRHDELLAGELARRIRVRGNRHQRRRLDDADERSDDVGSAAAAAAGQESQRRAGQRQGFRARQRQVRAAHRSETDPVRCRGRRASRDAFADHRDWEREEDPDRDLRRCGVQGDAGEGRTEQGR